jgi:signal transduction histidine kinase
MGSTSIEGFATATATVGGGVEDPAHRADRLSAFLARRWVEVLWVVFVLVNTVAIVRFADWATVPFHFIWIGLSLLYGWRVWKTPGTAVALVTVILLTGIALTKDVTEARQSPDELTELPLMGIVFVVMVWYVRRAVTRGEQIRRISEHNLALLQRQRQLVQDVSHVLRTPLTIALGHAELLLRGSRDPGTARDLEVVIDELTRLKHVSDRLLTLASSEQPDFVHAVDTRVDRLVMQAASSWSSSHPAVMLGRLAPLSVPLDRAQLRDALDELINNAIRHNPPHTSIALSVSSVDGGAAIAVTDRGSGIPPEEEPRIFDRFIRLRQAQPGDSGLGLGLALVKAIAEAHGGRLLLHSVPGEGTTFTLWLPGRGDVVPEIGEDDGADVAEESRGDRNPDDAVPVHGSPGTC